MSTLVSQEALRQLKANQHEARRMTYQIAMRGSDGIILASDRKEVLYPSPQSADGCLVSNDVTKIACDPKLRFAWSFAGGAASRIAAGYLGRQFESGIDESDIFTTLRMCGDAGAEAATPTPSDALILVDGKSKRILRMIPSRNATRVDEISAGICFAGQSSNRASFLPSRFYSSELTVAQLLRLAAYAVVTAGEIDPLMIGGVDIAVYYDPTPQFEFVSHGYIKEEAAGLNDNLRYAINSAIV